MRWTFICPLIVMAGCSQTPNEQPAPQDDVLATANSMVQGEEGTPYTASADPTAAYSLLSVKPGEGGNIVAMTRRTGSSGTSYSNREIDCRGQLARYIGEGDTREEAERPSRNAGEMAPLVEGSSTWAAVQAACVNQ